MKDKQTNNVHINNIINENGKSKQGVISRKTDDLLTSEAAKKTPNDPILVWLALGPVICFVSLLAAFVLLNREVDGALKDHEVKIHVGSLQKDHPSTAK